MIVVTMAANVPLNDALATVDAHAADGAQRWSDYHGRLDAVEPPARGRLQRGLRRAGRSRCA